MIFGAILAGGVGSRMQSENMPKQFLALGNKPIIIHTTEKLLLCSRLETIFIGIHPSWRSYMEDLISQHIPSGAASRIVVVDGGQTRNDTLFNVIAGIEARFGADGAHYIVTHDAVRPFVTLRILEENVEAVLAHGACDTVIPAVDTVVVSDDALNVSSIPVRSSMFLGQTPQSFHVNTLKELYSSLSDEEKETLTDACKIYTLKGRRVRMVDGDASNFKITTVNDLRIARAMLGGFDD